MAGYTDGGIWLFDLKKKLCEHVFSGHYESTTCGSLALNGEAMVTGSEDGSIFIWDTITTNTLFHLTGKSRRVCFHLN